MSIYDQYLLKTSREHFLDNPGELINVFDKLTEDLCYFLKAGRVSIWMYKNDNTTIETLSSFTEHKTPFDSNLELHKKDYPPYFLALEKDRIIQAENAFTHHATSCLSEGYLSHYGIKSMFDAPIWKSDQVIGVLCLEYFEVKPEWKSEEKNFIVSFADFLGKIFERNETLKLIEKLESQVEKRTEELSLAVSNLKKTQDFMVQQEKLASLGTIVAGVSHELRNPLNHIIASSDIISEHIQEDHYDKETTKKLITIIKSSALRANDIIKNMLNQVVESDEVEEIDILELIKQSFNLARFNQKIQGNISVQFDIKNCKKNIKLQLSKQKITQVLLNLFENSFYSMAEKSLDISDFIGVITISIHETGDTVNLCIKDNAKGIPQSKQDKIFEPFFTTKKVGDGTGLGLFIVYDIIKAHKGTISINSTENEFTEFIINLPKKQLVQA